MASCNTQTFAKDLYRIPHTLHMSSILITCKHGASSDDALSSWRTEIKVMLMVFMSGSPKMVNCSNISLKQTILKTGSYVVARKQVDIIISKNQALQILYHV